MRRLWKAVGCGRAMLLLLAVWFIILLLMASPFFRSPDGAGGGIGGGAADGTVGSAVDERTVAKRLARAFSDLEVLKKQNAELRNLFTDIDLKDPGLQQEQKDALLQDLQDRLQKAEKLLEESSRKGDAGAEVLRSEGEGEEPRAPSLEYEMTRRRVADGVRELWYYLGSQLKQLKALASPRFKQLAERIDNVLKEGAEHKRALLMNVNRLADVDGYSAWREIESLELSYLVQRRLHYLQNPPDCASARKLLCNLNKGCGYGCQVHHVVYCLIVAYGTRRTLVLRSKGWRYHKPGWEEVFHPVSDTCPPVPDPSGSITSGSHAHWPGKPNTQVVELPIVDSLSPRPPYLPLAVPQDLAPRLSRLHGDPIVWWVGQFLKFLLRPQPNVQKMLDSTARKLGFQRPIVGVHIRRTDKVGTEAAFHPLEEYMSAVEEWFNQLEMERNALPVTGTVQDGASDTGGNMWGHWGDVGGGDKKGELKRRVYLATDDPSVVIDARAKYPHYEILGDPSIARTAAVSTRYSDSSLFGIIIDIHFLSMSDYLVCTFSSQVCRIAYEIMQQLRPDASDRFRSLDDIYYYGGQGTHLREAILPHNPQEAAPGKPGAQEAVLSLEPGDLVGVAGNHWDGYSKGKSMRSGRVGLYPSFKVVDRIEMADFPTYAEVPLKHYPERGVEGDEGSKKGAGVGKEGGEGDEGVQAIMAEEEDDAGESPHRRGAEAVGEET